MPAFWPLLLISLQNPVDPASAENRFGAKLAEHIREENIPVNSPAARTYVETLVRRMAPPESVWTIEVIHQIDSSLNPTHEPLAFPGNRLLVPSRLLLDVQSESELAGMIAHAVAHLTRPEASQRMSNGLYVLAAGSLIPQTMLSHHRDIQLAADQEAVRLTIAAGFDPSALAAYLSRVKQGGEDLGSRLAALQRTRGSTPAPSAEFLAMQSEMRSLFPEKPRRKPSLFR